ncbi:YetF domain-containing protein [Heyndrickxia sp. NPDC080065]|uniref:YetF domain-containing protein n=1 Tax=Heyndrickxia sp. NPDC080065 TaxID=3390568 RepID=UPI003D05768B
MVLILDTIVRTFIGFFVLLLLIRLLGKKQLAHMSFFSYITGIALGNIAGDLVIHKDVKIIDGIIGLALWVFLTAAIEYTVLKFSRSRILFDGEPSIVIKHGKIMEKALSSNKLNMDDLSMLLRIKNVFAISEVEYAILEPNGQLSVLKKEEYEPVTKKDANIQVKRRPYIPTELVVDGKFIGKNLQELNINEDWLLNELKRKGFPNLNDIFYAELQTDGSIFVDRKINVQ